MKHTIIHIFILIIITQNIYAQSPALNVDECCCPELQTGVQDCAFGGQSEDTTIMVTSTDITSAGANDGTFTVSGTGIYDMDFSTGMMADSVMSATEGGLSPGVYQVIITDEVGCIATGEAVIEEPERGCCELANETCSGLLTEVECNAANGTWVPNHTCNPATQKCEPIATIPTLSEWGLIILALLMLIIGVVAIRSERDLQSAPAKT